MGIGRKQPGKKIWRFMEDLSPSIDLSDDEKRITLCDLKNKKFITLEIDTTDHRYMKINGEQGL